MFDKVNHINISLHHKDLVSHMNNLFKAFPKLTEITIDDWNCSIPKTDFSTISESFDNIKYVNFNNVQTQVWDRQKTSFEVGGPDFRFARMTFFNHYCSSLREILEFSLRRATQTKLVEFKMEIFTVDICQQKLGVMVLQQQSG